MCGIGIAFSILLLYHFLSVWLDSPVQPFGLEFSLWSVVNQRSCFFNGHRSVIFYFLNESSFSTFYHSRYLPVLQLSNWLMWCFLIILLISVETVARPHLPFSTLVICAFSLPFLSVILGDLSKNQLLASMGFLYCFSFSIPLISAFMFLISFLLFIS